MGTDTGDGGTETYVVMFRVEVTVVAMVVVTGNVRAEETVVVVVEDLEVLAVAVGEEEAREPGRCRQSALRL